MNRAREGHTYVHILGVAQGSTGEAGNDANKAYGVDSASVAQHDEDGHEEVEPMMCCCVYRAG